MPRHELRPIRVTLPREMRFQPGMRRLGLRKNDDTPSWIEIAVPVAIWSYVFKVYLPFVTWLPRNPAADPADIRAFAFGGLCALVFWDWWYGERRGKRQAS